MTDLRKAAEMALEALESAADNECNFHDYKHAAAALRQALEQPQTPDDLLRQSEREGWRYANECEAEVKRLRQALEQPDPVEEAVLAEREACAKVCDDRAMRCEKAAQEAVINGEHDEVSSIRSTAWQISVCATMIRARGE